MTTKPPEIHHVPPPAPGGGRPAVHVPPPSQAPRAAQHVPAPTQSPVPSVGRGHGASQARPTGPQHVPAPAPSPAPGRGAAPSRGAASAAQSPMVTQTRGQQRSSGPQQQIGNNNTRGNPAAARQGQRVADQSSQRAPSPQQVPAQQSTPQPRTAPAVAPAPAPAAAAPPTATDASPKIPATATEFASRYANQARILRNRAKRAGLSAEDVAEYERRAAWFEGRADVFARNGFMSRALRTPAEGVEGADYFRRALVGLLEGMADLDGIEAGILAGAVHQADPTTIQRAAQLFNTWRAGSEMLVQLLGVEAGEFDPDKPADRWRFRVANLVQINAAASIADAGRVQEEQGEQEPAAPAAAAPPVQIVHVEDVTGQASRETPIVVAPPVVNPAEAVAAGTLVPAGHIDAGGDVVITAIPPTLAPPAPPPAAKPEEEKTP
jgi:hypothetical protein